MFNSPNTAAMMGAVPAHRRGVAAGASTLLQNTGAVLSIAFVLAIVTSAVPKATLFAVFSGLAKGLSRAEARAVHRQHARGAVGAGGGLASWARLVCLLRPRHVPSAASQAHVAAAAPARLLAVALTRARRRAASEHAAQPASHDGRPAALSSLAFRAGRAEHLTDARARPPPQRPPPSLARTSLRIGDVARLVGTTPRTIRYYEEIGLLPGAPPGLPASIGSTREAEVERLREVMRLKDLLGVSLDELKTLLTAEEARAEVRAQLRREDVDTGRRRELL